MKQSFYLTFLLCFVFAAQSFADFSGPLENDTIVQLTPEGVEVVADDDPAGMDGRVFVPIGNQLFFVAKDATHGEELWITDGTKEGTHVIDVWVGDSSSAPSSLTVSNGKLYFSATTKEQGRELWVTDGTETKIVYDLYEGEIGSAPEFLTDFNGKLLFKAADALSEGKKFLWMTDGTEDGTEFIKEVEPQPITNGFSRHIVTVGDKAFFAGNDGTYGTELWVTDGTEDMTYMVLDITFFEDPENPGGTLGTWLENLYDCGDFLIFRAQTPAFWLGKDDAWVSTHNNLWISDGTAFGTYCIIDLNTDPDPDDPTSTGNSGASNNQFYKGNIWFRATHAVANNEPWITDGTPENTKLFMDMNGIKEGDGQNKPSWYEYLTPFDGWLFFGADIKFNFNESTYLPLVGKELFASNGDTVVMVADIFPGTNNNSKPKQFKVVNNRMYFQANDAAKESNKELWACEMREKDTIGWNVYQVFDELDNGTPIQLTDMGSNLYFTTLSTKKLYKYDDGEVKVGPYSDTTQYGPKKPTLKNDYIVRYQTEIGDTADYVPDMNVPNSLFSNKVANAFNVYPNPASQSVTIDFNAASANVKIVSLTGAVLYNELVTNYSTIDISTLASGTYIIVAESDDTIRYSKLTIQ